MLRGGFLRLSYHGHLKWLQLISDISQMFDLGIIQLAIKFYTFLLQKYGTSEKLLLLGEGFELAWANLKHSGVENLADSLCPL